MKNKAQSILEYVVIFGIASVALFAMQIYFRRSIQAVIKLSSDQMGEQKKGAADVDYKLELKNKGDQKITAYTSATTSNQEELGGAATFTKSESTTQEGIISQVWVRNEEQ